MAVHREFSAEEKFAERQVNRHKKPIELLLTPTVSNSEGATVSRWRSKRLPHVRPFQRTPDKLLRDLPRRKFQMCFHIRERASSNILAQLWMWLKWLCSSPLVAVRH
jgi:hypothetical protein